ncbi:MAG: formylglycine-generating enzyme family protein [Euryarchaeota archaeon]|nr:formylglycine-generating enzyme family protein [Euryarchaeota archaeon]
MKFTLIPAGEFMMGSEDYDDEKPAHKVKIRKPFYLGTYPVTQREWKAIMGDNPSYSKGDDLPVEQVSWRDVQKFIRKLNEKEGTDRYRLTSEAEWEYAYRAGTTTRYSFGDSGSKLGDYAWYYENSDRKTHPVGKKKPNPYGLYDMHGNVWEWVQDRWHGDYEGAPTDGSAWESGDGFGRVNRGGSWSDIAGHCLPSYRHYDGPGARSSNLGFRLIEETQLLFTLPLTCHNHESVVLEAVRGEDASAD